VTDDLFWDFHEKLTIELEREPTYEEVQEAIAGAFKTTKEQEVEFNQRKVYGNTN